MYANRCLPNTNSIYESKLIAAAAPSAFEKESGRLISWSKIGILEQSVLVRQRGWVVVVCLHVFFGSVIKE